MENTENYLLVLEESLNKKITILEELERLTAIQKEIVTAEQFDDEAFNTNVEQKGALISELEKLDKGFQILYDNVKAQVENNRQHYRDEIVRLQTGIKTITDKNAALLVMESSNRELIVKRFATLKKEARQMKKSRELASNYYKTMNNISSEPYFLDKKK
ncbi:MAG: hypothetical protein ACI4EN_02090 [Butyrivibrio sp.]